MVKKKIWANFQRIVEVFTQKIFNMLLNIWIWDPGSGIRDPGSGKNLFRIPDPGVKKAPDAGSGSATLPVIPIQILRANGLFRLEGLRQEVVYPIPLFSEVILQKSPRRPEAAGVTDRSPQLGSKCLAVQQLHKHVFLFFGLI
jgi:hypothetical protein